jgi:hypothetical protein
MLLNFSFAHGQFVSVAYKLSRQSGLIQFYFPSLMDGYASQARDTGRAEFWIRPHRSMLCCRNEISI